MGTRFVAEPAVGNLVIELSNLSSANPFATANCFQAKRQLGFDTWVFGLRDDAGRLECGCGGFLKSGKLNRILEILSLPSVGAESKFWDGLLLFCRHHSVTQLELGTYGSPPGGQIPTYVAHCMRRSRSEYVLDLANDLAIMLSSNHKRNVKRAQQAGLKVERARSTEAATVHLMLMNESMDRRRSRGENAKPMGPSPECVALLQCGAGELFQAVLNETVLSSVFVLRAPNGGYYQSAGTSQEGMAVGASHFLIYSIADALRTEGAQVLNLGGADETSGLARFKREFGALRVSLPSASCYVGRSWRRKVSRAIDLWRSDRQTLLRLLIGRISRLIVYAANTGIVRMPESRVSLTFRALTSEDLRGLSVGDPSFCARQLERLDRFGASYAYAVFVGGEIAHVSWLLPPIALAKDAPQVLRLRVDEAEITACETLPKFRGRGIYGFAICNLLEVARDQGVRRIFMKTASDNTASQRGIEKTGLKRVGSVILITLPIIQRPVVLRCFR